jgi:Tol biopolymer transport system component
LNSRQFILTCVLIFAALMAASFFAQPTTAQSSAAIAQLTDDRAVSVRAVWSPDNKLIAYQSNRESETNHIYVMNPDGTNARAVTKGASDDRHPSWTPDGKSLLYDSYDGKSREIWTVNVADGTTKQLSHQGGLSNFAAASPDGQRIAFYFYKDDVLHLWIMRSDGTDAKPLVTKVASAQNNQCTFACHTAGWSPDGKMLAYSAGELDSIWTISSDGTNSRKVIDNGEDNHFPWFLPDGRLAYITEHVQPSDKAWTDAWIYDLKTGERLLVHERMAMQGPFEWSSDGNRVLFHSPRNGNFNIYLIDLAAPGGLDALQGKVTGIPASAPTPFPLGKDAQTQSQSTDVKSILLIGTAALLGLILIAGIVLGLLKRNA